MVLDDSFIDNWDYFLIWSGEEEEEDDKGNKNHFNRPQQTASVTILPAPLILLLLSGIVFYKASQLVRRRLRKYLNYFPSSNTHTYINKCLNAILYIHIHNVYTFSIVMYFFYLCERRIPYVNIYILYE